MAVVLRQPVAVHRVTGATSLRRRASVRGPEAAPALSQGAAIALTAETVEPPAATPGEVGLPAR